MTNTSWNAARLDALTDKAPSSESGSVLPWYGLNRVSTSFKVIGFDMVIQVTFFLTNIVIAGILTHLVTTAVSSESYIDPSYLAYSWNGRKHS